MAANTSTPIIPAPARLRPAAGEFRLVPGPLLPAATRSWPRRPAASPRTPRAARAAGPAPGRDRARRALRADRRPVRGQATGSGTSRRGPRPDQPPPAHRRPGHDRGRGNAAGAGHPVTAGRTHLHFRGHEPKNAPIRNRYGQRSARRVPDRRERPGRTQPLRHGLVQHHVERGMVRADPRPHISNGSIGSVGRIGSIGIDVHAPDDLVAAGRAHRIREPRTPGEVRGVPFQVAQVLRQRHVRHRPRPPLEPRSRPDMGNAGGPGPVVVLIVLRPQRLKPESLTRQRTRHVKVVRYEAHRHTLTRGHGGRGAHGQPHLGQRLGRGQRPPAELLEPADPRPSARSRRPRRRCSGTRTTCWPSAATTPSPTRCSG
jgi:hypothetical protein